MKPLVLSCGLAFMPTLAALSYAAEAGAPEIREITTLEQLEGLEPLRVAGGWEVRLGLAEPGAEAGPWRLLYCHARHSGDGKEAKLALDGDFYGQFLGPVFFTLDERADSVGKMAGKWTLPAEGLYCALILTAWEGARTVRVVSGAGKVIARKALRVEKPGICYWQFLATWRKERQAGLPGWAALAKAYAARPDFDGLTPLWPPDDRQRVKFAVPAGGTSLY